MSPFDTREPSVIVLTKVPAPGRVKTRLAPALGEEGAMEMHCLLAEATLALAARSGLPVGVSLSGPLDSSFAEALRSTGVPVEAQAEGDLGDRLRHALRGPGRRIALGTDCPLFEPAWLRLAARSAAPVAFGPSEDGGYWTVAIDPPQDEIFRDIPWSSSETLSVSLARARAAGILVELLPRCLDIDEPPALGQLASSPRCPPAIRAFLERHGVTRPT